MAARPNILIVYADQHRADVLGARGNPDVRTPAIDALAGDGVLYENCFCSYPVCTPSRYSFLSGLYVHEHRGWTNHCTLAPAIETFPRILRRAGYRTTAVGKMHFTPTYLDVGFEEMWLCEQDGPGRWDDDYHRDLMALGLADVNDLEDQRGEYRARARDEYRETFGAMPSNLPEEHYSTTWIGRKALADIARWSGGGNLLMVGFVKPHHPFDPPEPWFGMYDPGQLTILPGWTEQCLARDLAHGKGYFPQDALSEPALRRVMAAYYASVSQIDHWTGKMVDLLKAKDMYDDTLIVYTADHGDYVGFHHMILKGNYMYDPLVRVPLVVKYPRGAHRGRSASLVSCVDPATTILAQAGCDAAPGMRGLDLARAPGGRQIVYAEGWMGRPVMVRTASAKLLVEDGRELLFDLGADPLEMEDVSTDAAHGAERARLRDAADRWRDASNLPGTYLDEHAPRIARPHVPDVDDDHRQRIATWYLEAVRRAGMLAPE